ncbi:hypothetical protein [Pantoea agglomerans]
MKKVNYGLISSALIISSLLNILSVNAAPDSNAYGDKWQISPDPVSEQAQLIYYYPVNDTSAQSALVYVDDELQSTLLPGTFARFCLKAGSHTLGAYPLNIAVTREADSLFRAQFQAGKTYYLRISNRNDGQPQAVRRAEAEKQLTHLRQATFALSRANAAVDCRYPPTNAR